MACSQSRTRSDTCLGNAEVGCVRQSPTGPLRQLLHCRQSICLHGNPGLRAVFPDECGELGCSSWVKCLICIHENLFCSLISLPPTLLPSFFPLSLPPSLIFFLPSSLPPFLPFLSFSFDTENLTQRYFTAELYPQPFCYFFFFYFETRS